MLSFLLNYWYLVLVALVSGAYLVYPLFNGMGPRRVGPVEAVPLLNGKNSLLLDIREADVRDADGTFIAKARHIPASQLEGRLGELKKFKDRPVIVQCSTGRSAVAAAALLQKNEFADVYVLDGGLQAWVKAELPVSSIRAGA